MDGTRITIPRTNTTSRTKRTHSIHTLRPKKGKLAAKTDMAGSGGVLRKGAIHITVIRLEGATPIQSRGLMDTVDTVHHHRLAGGTTKTTTGPGIDPNHLHRRDQTRARTTAIPDQSPRGPRRPITDLLARAPPEQVRPTPAPARPARDRDEACPTSLPTPCPRLSETW